ncbi:MAG: DUF1918 domain-containing protein [Actinomycetota bacterium]
MPKPGDRVVVEGSKVGGGRREGTLVETLGSLIKVRWTDGGETIMAPGAGSVSFLPGSAKAAKHSAVPKKKAAKPAVKAKSAKKN